MARPSLVEKDILNPSEAIEYFVLSRRKFCDLLNNTDGEEQTENININITLMENHILYTVGNWSLRINFQRAKSHAFPFVSWKNR